MRSNTSLQRHAGIKKEWAAGADVTEDSIAFLVVRDITPLQVGNGGSVCRLGIGQNGFKANVHSINLNLGMEVSNWILSPWDMGDHAAVLGYCREMTLLSGKPGALDSSESVCKGRWLVLMVKGMLPNRWRKCLTAR